MAFNVFATATTSIPLANLDANFTLLGSAAAASTLYPTATTSITYGTTGTTHYFSGSGLAVTGTFSATGLTLNSSGNLGVGVTPSAWSTSNSTRAIQISSVGSIWGNVNSSSFNNNWYLASGDVSTYISTAPATRYVQDATGIHQWFYAASGTAGATMTLSEAMRIDTSGNLGIGTSSPSAKLQINGATDTIKTYGTYYNQLTNDCGTGGFSQTSYSVVGASKGLIGANATHMYINTAADASAYISFETGSSSTERMRLDSSGNLGLGVTPSAWVSTIKAIQIGAQGAVSYFANNNGVNLTNNFYYNGSANIYIATGYASTYLQTAGQHQWSTAPSGTAGASVTLTQAMTLDNSGNLMVGTTSATSPNPGIGMAVGGNAQITIGHDTTSASGQYYEVYKYNASVIGGITQSGTTAVLYNVTSDQRLKENIQDAESSSALIDALQVRQFDWKTDNTHQRYGFIAQELVTVAPEAVHQPKDSEEMMAVDYSKLVPMLVKEIQSLRARVAQLETKGV